MLGIGLLALQQLSAINGVFFYSSTIFSNAGVSQEKIASFGLGVVQVLSTEVATWLMDKAGRRVLLIISSIGVTISLLIVSATFFIEIYGSGQYMTFHVVAQGCFAGRKRCLI